MRLNGCEYFAVKHVQIHQNIRMILRLAHIQRLMRHTVLFRSYASVIASIDCVMGTF